MGGAIRLRAPAKLNLGLEILARRPDGYHEIETVFLPLRLFDELELSAGAGPGATLNVVGAGDPLPTDGSNLVQRAAQAACAALGIECALSISLTKRIPVAAGLGGGSSDAAATLLGVEALVGRSLEPGERARIARDLGADVPFFLDPQPAIGRGIGERLEPIPNLPEMAWVLVAFPFGISTPWAYSAASARLTLPRARSSIAALLGPSGVRSNPPNDLESASCARHPEIGAARAALEEVGAMLVGMSGSGPTVYGRFASLGEAEVAVARASLPAGARAIAVTSPSSGARHWGWGVAKR